MIYLDNAATTLIKPSSVGLELKRASRSLASPGRGGHAAAMRAAEVLFNCREKAADMFGVSNPEHIVFTSSATHGLNIAIRSLLHPGDKVLVSGYEHNSVIRPIKAIGAKMKVARSELFEPEVILAAFERNMTRDVKLVVCTHVSNVFGYVLPIEKVAELCAEKKIPLIIDAAQSAGVLDVNMQRLKADYIAMPGHKGLYGPQGTGILVCGEKMPVPLLYGGTGSKSMSYDMPDFLPDMLEAGTHNMPGIAALFEGLDFISRAGIERIYTHEKNLLDIASKGLKSIRKVDCYCSEHGFAQSGVVSFNVSGADSEEIGRLLSERGIAVRAGLHCAPIAHETVGTVKTGTVRASFSYFTTKRDIYVFLNALEDIAAKV